jgi:electron transport complex protein RnfE
MADKHAPDQMDNFVKGLWRDNPVLVMLLGMCPVLAVTVTVPNAIAMGLSTTFVLVCSSTLISLGRKLIPKQVRIAAYIIIIATFVTVVDLTLPAISLGIYNALGAFIALIVVNCIILGRAEAYASRNDVKRALVDALGMGAGFTIALVMLAAPRELLGNGTLMGVRIFGEMFEPWAVMVLPPGAFFTLGILLFGINWLKERRAARADRQAAAADTDTTARAA